MIHLVAKTGAAINADAARAYIEQVATQAQRSNHDLMTVDDPRDIPLGAGIGVYHFIGRVEHLFGTNPNPTRVESQIQVPGTPLAWSVYDSEGQGDSDSDAGWVTNAAWFDYEFPDLLHILGVMVSRSASMYGGQATNLPRKQQYPVDGQ